MSTKVMCGSPKAKVGNQFNINLFNIINSNDELSTFFQQRASSKQQFQNLAKQLLLHAIKTKNDIPKRYNVAYIKHNRFLSPSQKRQVTPKVTQMIPLSPEKLVIYGKPKVILDDGVGCPLHQHLCPQQQIIENKKTTKFYPTYPTRDYEQESYHQEDPQILQNKYGSKNRAQIQSSTQNRVQSPKIRNSKKSKKSSQIQETMNIKSRITSPKNETNMNFNASHYKQNHEKIVSSRRKHSNRCCQNYENIQSKIKFLIDRDKHNKMMQKKLQEQINQIQQMEIRQRNLLFLQQQQSNFIKQSSLNTKLMQKETSYRQTKPKIVIPYDDSDSFSSSDLSCLQIAKIHKHITKAERLRCYQCELQRLKREKQRAKKSIMDLHRDERKRSAYEYSCDIQSQSESSCL